MRFTSLSKIALATSVVLTGMAYAAPSFADSQVQLHELLFNRKKRQQRQALPKVVQPTPQAVKRAPAAPIKRITGPQYYTYKAQSVGSFALAELVPDRGTTASVTVPDAGILPPLTVLGNDRFDEALKHVPDEKVTVEPEIGDAVKAHYAANPAFLWVDGMNVNANGKALVEELADAGAHGLFAGDYALDLPPSGWSMDNPAARYSELIAFELKATALAVRYAMDMKDGAVNPNKLSGYHDFSGKRLTAEQAIADLSNRDDVSAYLASITPKQPAYAALAAELAALRVSREDTIVIPEGTFLRPGNVVEALPLVMKAIELKANDDVRAKHALTFDAYSGTTLYDGALVELVRDMQRQMELVPDGIVGPKTIARLGGDSIASRMERVALAMERMRWHPEQYGGRQVVINAPEYRVRYMENNETKLAMRTVVGKPSNQTYFFHDEIETVVFNPYWGVPQSIIVNEMLPRLQRDPGYLDRAGYVVTSRSGKQISSSAINWNQYSGPVPYNVRQKPGPNNALGELKILFPNTHAIYMHDTPAKQLFSRDARAFSHGCVRLEDPRAMAAAVLGKDRSYVASQLGGYEKGEQLKDKVPVYVGYFTAWPNDDGKIAYHADIYKRDVYLRRALDAVRTARAG